MINSPVIKMTLSFIVCFGFCVNTKRALYSELGTISKIPSNAGNTPKIKPNPELSTWEDKDKTPNQAIDIKKKAAPSEVEKSAILKNSFSHNEPVD